MNIIRQKLNVEADRLWALRMENWTGRLFTGTAIATIMVLAACASEPLAPTAAMQAAESAIATAEQSRVADTATPELNEAREKLTAAHEAVREEKMIRAQRLAEQSRVDAEFATAKNENIKALAINAEMQKSVDAMKQEMQRNAGVR